MKNGIEPVKIIVENNQRFAQVALVLDNKKIQKKIPKLRSKWGIKEFYRNVRYADWWGKLGDKYSQFNKEIDLLRISLKLDPIFTNVLLRAVVCNEVRDIDFKTAYLKPVSISNSRDKNGRVQVEYVIVITPDTTFSDVKEVLSKFKSDVEYSRNSSQKKVKEFRFIPNLPRKVLEDTKSEIKRDRDWYWEHKNGKSPLEIAKKNSNVDPYQHKETVTKAIKSYRRLLREF